MNFSTNLFFLLPKSILRTHLPTSRFVYKPPSFQKYFNIPSFRSRTLTTNPPPSSSNNQETSTSLPDSSTSSSKKIKWIIFAIAIILPVSFYDFLKTKKKYNDSRYLQGFFYTTRDLSFNILKSTPQLSYTLSRRSYTLSPLNSCEFIKTEKFLHFKLYENQSGLTKKFLLKFYSAEIKGEVEYTVIAIGGDPRSPHGIPFARVKVISKSTTDGKPKITNIFWMTADDTDWKSIYKLQNHLQPASSDDIRIPHEEIEKIISEVSLFKKHRRLTLEK